MGGRECGLKTARGRGPGTVEGHIPARHDQKSKKIII